MIRLVMHGAAGRMGSRVCALARTDSRFELVGAIDQDEQFETSIDRAVEVDVIIDFSSDEGAGNAVRMATDHAAAVLIGTTGLSRQTLDITEVAARRIPIMVAPNTSRGVAVLTRLVVEAARLLGDEYDVNLIELHHLHKRDAPSGTALRIADQMRCKASVDLTADRIHSIRSGDIVGEHIIEFGAPGERIRFHHVATDRDLFARGALRLAAWLTGRAPGQYTIDHAFDSSRR